MAGNKGRPSGKYAETKSSVRKRDYQRSDWPEDAPTQRTDPNLEGEGVEDRNEKTGSPV